MPAAPAAAARQPGRRRLTQRPNGEATSLTVRSGYFGARFAAFATLEHAASRRCGQRRQCAGVGIRPSPRVGACFPRSWNEVDGDVGWSGAEFLAERFGLRVEPGARRDAAT